MENLPDALVSDILRRIDKTSDKNAVSMASKRLCDIEAEHRDFLRVGCGLHPAAEALTLLCIRFRNLYRVEIVYSGWISNMGKQLDNQGLLLLASHCPKLADLTLGFCSFIDDIGLGHLASCKRLSALKLGCVPAISSNGLLSIAVGCRNLSTLHLDTCTKVKSVEWLEYLGEHGNLESLSIESCSGLDQDDLVIFGRGWKKLRHLALQFNISYRYWTAVSDWKSLELRCDKLRELSLVNCSLEPERPLSSILGRCKALENLCLDMCCGLEDSILSALSQKSCRLRRFKLILIGSTVSPGDPFNLTDSGFKELAHGCFMLEEFELSFSGVESVPFPGLTQAGILSIIQSCPLRVLILNDVRFFNDVGMEALLSAHLLQSLELVECQNVTNEGLHHVVDFPSLETLKLSKCFGVCDTGLRPLVGVTKLNTLIVEDCPLISDSGVQHAARYVSYRQDLAWITGYHILQS